MKHLNIKWVPETFAIVSLTMITSEPAAPCPETAPSQDPFVIAGLARTKHIVISGRHELKAAVTTTAAALVLV